MKLNLILMGVAAIVQLAVPGWMIGRHEWTLATGEVYKFKTRPVDPYDVFRGRYVALAFEQSHAPADDPDHKLAGKLVYATLGVDDDGFAYFKGVRLDAPPEEPYLKVKASHVRDGRVYLDLPFDRYYMKESKAPEAEAAYRRHSRRGEQRAWVSLRVKSGYGVIEELFVDGAPIAEFVEQNGEDRK